MIQSENDNGTSQAGNAVDPQKMVEIGRKLKQRMLRIPLERRIANWWKRCGNDLVEELKRLHRNGSRFSIWDVIGVETGGLNLTRNGYEISPEFALQLVEATFENPEAYDMAQEIAGVNLARGTPLPEPLEIFSAAVIRDLHLKPTAVGRRRTSWYRDSLIVKAVREAKQFGFYATRNEASDGPCGCSLVYEAMCKSQPAPIKYDRVVEIWKARKDIESDLERVHLAVSNAQFDPPDDHW